MTEAKTERHGEWLLKSDARSVASAVRQYGVITFQGNGLTESENVAVATRTISSLNEEVTTLATFFLTMQHNDDSYESVTYAIADYSLTSGMSSVVLERTIRYKTFGMGERTPFVTRGPLVPRGIAQAMCDMLNNQTKG